MWAVYITLYRYINYLVGMYCRLIKTIAQDSVERKKPKQTISIKK